MKAAAILSLTVIAMAACSTQGVAHDTITSASGTSCKVDVASICNAIRNAPVISANTGISEDNRMRQNNSRATVNETVPYRIPGGSLIEVRCEIRGRDNNVVYAGLESGGQFTDQDVEQMRQVGLCQ